jgi:hypothetical protein
MKPRIRSIRSLYHRWGKGLDLSATQVSRALVRAGLIKYQPHAPELDPTHYTETEALREAKDFERLVFETLTEYKVQNGLT